MGCLLVLLLRSALAFSLYCPSVLALCQKSRWRLQCQIRYVESIVGSDNGSKQRPIRKSFIAERIDFLLLFEGAKQPVLCAIAHRSTHTPGAGT